MKKKVEPLSTSDSTQTSPFNKFAISLILIHSDSSKEIIPQKFSLKFPQIFFSKFGICSKLKFLKFKKHNLIIEKKYNTLKNKTYIQKKLILPKSLKSDLFTRPLKFPNIIKPKTIKLSDVNNLIKPIVSRERHVVISKELINCLNYSCRKKI